MEAALRDSRQEEPAQLLQVKAAPRRAPPTLVAQSEELKKTLPVGWVHCPKCGTSFMNVLVHLPGVCPQVPDNLTVSKFSFPGRGWRWSQVFTDMYDVPGSCPGLLDLGGAHDGFKYLPHFEETRGNFMTMLRDPEQRTLATWYDLQGCLEKGENFSDLIPSYRSWGGLPDGKVPNITDFAFGYRGCVTKMLTREGFRCGDKVPPTEAEVEEARERLHTDFSFIGMTDDWALSMCLLSAQFQVRCLPAMMVDTRTARDDDTELYDTAPLQGIEDPYDRVIFEEGKKIFNARLKKFNVTEEWCKQTCWKDAGWPASFAYAITNTTPDSLQSER